MQFGSAHPPPAHRVCNTAKDWGMDTRPASLFMGP